MTTYAVHPRRRPKGWTVTFIARYANGTKCQTSTPSGETTARRFWQRVAENPDTVEVLLIDPDGRTRLTFNRKRDGDPR